MPSTVTKSQKSLLQINVSKELSRKLQTSAKSYGLNKSSLARFLLTKGLNNLEREELTENGFTRDEEEEILQRIEESKRGINMSSFSSMKEMIHHLDKQSGK